MNNFLLLRMQMKFQAATFGDFVPKDLLIDMGFFYDLDSWSTDVIDLRADEIGMEELRYIWELLSIRLVVIQSLTLSRSFVRQGVRNRPNKEKVKHCQYRSNRT